ncbi:MAG: hypothetical protein N2651_06260, partial [Fimbriimonadales bacterium]|nr:hypothetical protein [Fimbriimonadales bacterium]
MRRLWGVSLGVLGVWAWSIADTSGGIPRTPNGMLWAGTTFQLRASVSMNNQPVALSSEAQVRVGQVIRWQWQLESPTGQSVPQGTDALFRVRVVNDGNGWDNLVFGLTQSEIENTNHWSVALFEDIARSGQISGSRQISDAGSLLPPGDDMLYFVRMRPPGSSIPTDGAWSSMAASTSNGTISQTLSEFTAGVVRPA